MGDYTYVPQNLAATISNGQSQSAGIDTTGYIVKEIRIPQTGWNNANLTFLTSTDNVTFYPLYDADGTEVTYTVGTLAANRAIRVPTGDLDGARYLKLRSGTSGTPVALAADCAIVVVMRPAS